MIRPLPNNLYFGQLSDEGWAYIGNAFTPDECTEIIQTCTEGKLTTELLPGLIDVSGQTVLNKSVRNSHISWIDYEVEETRWIWERIQTGVSEVNKNVFKFDLGDIQRIQFSKYGDDLGKYDKHTDTNNMADTVRKISVSIQLSDPDDYQGGDLNLYSQEAPYTMPREQGMMILFPSFMLHEVTPVTQGTRYSLVAWIMGPKFK